MSKIDNLLNNYKRYISILLQMPHPPSVIFCVYPEIDERRSRENRRI